MTMTNAEWMLKNGMKFSRLTWAHINGRNIVYYRKNKYIELEIYSEKSVNPENLITKWLDMGHREQILDDAEKRYLSAVIRPFRDRVEYIAKATVCGLEEDSYIFIHFTDASYDMDFPLLRGSNMYKCMRPCDKYTLEELGL